MLLASAEGKVGILGAGAGGLYTAFILGAPDRAGGRFRLSNGGKVRPSRAFFHISHRMI